MAIDLRDETLGATGQRTFTKIESWRTVQRHRFANGHSIHRSLSDSYRRTNYSAHRVDIRVLSKRHGAWLARAVSWRARATQLETGTSRSDAKSHCTRRVVAVRHLR